MKKLKLNHLDVSYFVSEFRTKKDKRAWRSMSYTDFDYFLFIDTERESLETDFHTRLQVADLLRLSIQEVCADLAIKKNDKNFDSFYKAAFGLDLYLMQHKWQAGSCLNKDMELNSQ